MNDSHNMDQQFTVLESNFPDHSNCSSDFLASSDAHPMVYQPRSVEDLSSNPDNTEFANGAKANGITPTNGYEVLANPQPASLSNQSYVRSANNPQLGVVAMEEFEQRKRHRSAGPEVHQRPHIEVKPSYADLLAFSHPANAPVGIQAQFAGRVELPQPAPYLNMMRSALDVQSRTAMASELIQEHQYHPQPNHYSNGNISYGDAKQRHVNSRERNSSESSSADGDSYLEPDSSSSAMEVANIMESLSYQRNACPMSQNARGVEFAQNSIQQQQVPIPAHHHSTGQMRQHHFSGPAGIPLNSVETSMMNDQQRQYYGPSQPFSSQSFPHHQMAQNSSTNGVNFAALSQPSSDPRRINSAAAVHNRHPSEPASRPRRPSAGKASRVALEHHAASTNQSVVVRDEQRKRQHNDIEKRRRSNINERIQQLATLLPNCQDPEFKQHKGNILTKVVEYIRQLQGMPEQLAAIQVENSKLVNQNLQLQQRVNALTELIKSNGFQLPSQYRFGEQTLVELATAGMASTGINNHSPSAQVSQSMTPPGSRHPSGNAQYSNSSPIPSVGVLPNRPQQMSSFNGDLLQMFSHQQQQHQQQQQR